MIFFTCSLPISENICSPLLFVLYFWTSKVRAKKLLFGFFWWSKLARLVPAQLLPLFKIATEEGNAKCDCLSQKSCTSKNHRNIFHHTDQQICSCFNSLRKQKKGKNKYKHDLCFAFNAIIMCLMLMNQTLWRSHFISSGFVFHQGF